MPAKLRIGFFGAGKMAAALARGFIRAGLVSAEDVLASDPSEAARNGFNKDTGANVTTSNLEVAEFASSLLLAVKPDQVAGVLSEVRERLGPKKLLLSIAAGVTLVRLEAAAGEGTRVIRLMPNTPALVGASATGFALGKSALPTDGKLAEQLFSSVGLAIQVKEGLLDAVTGLSGSGPAYIYMVIEALSDGGVASGLPRDVATRLAAQTVFGGARMVLETGVHPGALKDMVTSPGGTTIEGVHELEKGKLRGTLMSAVRAATEKSRKLGQG